MYVFEFNDNLHYRSRRALAEELREVADRIESGCNNLPSSIFRAPAGWIHKDIYDSDDEEDNYSDDDDFELDDDYEEPDYE